MSNGAVEKVICPYRLKGEWCVKENGYFICPTRQRSFTEKQSIEASKKRLPLR